MKLIAQVKLLPDSAQRAALRRTLEVANAACTYTSKRAWETKTFGQYRLHHLCYREIRDRFGLTAQVAVRVIAKVADAYKLDRNRFRRFKPTGGMAYDDRILRWKLTESKVSIWTIDGRAWIPFVCGPRQRALLMTRLGETDMVHTGKHFLLLATCEVEEPTPGDFTDAIGVDLGIKNIAVDSDGRVHSSAHLNGLRHRHRRLRSRLQSKGTHAARRLLKKRSRKESRFVTHTNHCISKTLVATAQGTGRAIALEDLRHIRERITARRDQRATLSGWAFGQLRAFVSYKARLAGIPVVLVDPRNTSKTCPACGNIDKANRKSQSLFSCVACGFAGLADHIAAVNIRRAAINRSNIPDTPEERCSAREKPRQRAAG